MLSIYNLGIHLYQIAVALAAPFNEKASKFLKGRKRFFQKHENQFSSLDQDPIWVHCASLGEFEQGRPLIEEIKATSPETPIVLTFFSPSGYEVRKDYELADVVTYLPLDTVQNAQKFIDATHPKAVYFIKYEWWYHYTHEIYKRNIPLYSVSCIFREGQPFFKKRNGLHLKILQHFSHFFVQHSTSKNLLSGIGFNNSTIVGDTRFDRVAKICAQPKALPEIKKFVNGQFCIVIGSSWPEDLAVIAPELLKYDIKIIVAPHELNESVLKKTSELLHNDCVRYSTLGQQDAKTLIIDNMGMLSSVYQFADIAYIGGAFGKGLHNTLEAATYGLPLIFGPKYEKFQEAKDMVARQSAFSITSSADFKNVFHRLHHDAAFRAKTGELSKKYVDENLGATSKILKLTAWKD